MEEKRYMFIKNAIKVVSGLFAGIPLIGILRDANVSNLFFSAVQCIFFIVYYWVLDLIFAGIESKSRKSSNNSDPEEEFDLIDLTDEMIPLEKGTDPIRFKFHVQIDPNNGRVSILQERKIPPEYIITPQSAIYKKYVFSKEYGIDLFDPNLIPADITNLYYRDEKEEIDREMYITNRRVCRLDQVDRLILAEFIQPFDQIDNLEEFKQIFKEITGRTIGDIVELFEWTFVSEWDINKNAESEVQTE